MGHTARKDWSTNNFKKKMNNKVKIGLAIVAVAAVGYFVVMPVLKKSSGF